LEAPFEAVMAVAGWGVSGPPRDKRPDPRVEIHPAFGATNLRTLLVNIDKADL